jgi:phospholipid-transporting ATPase
MTKSFEIENITPNETETSLEQTSQLEKTIKRYIRCCLHSKTHPLSSERIIQVGTANKCYTKNKIRTAKYTWYNFLPKNLIEQYMNLANVYFLVMMCLSLIKQISISDGIPNLLPSIIIILVFTGIKDFLEDAKRTRSDNEENRRHCEIWSQKSISFNKQKWAKFRVGEIIKVMKNDPIPCDMILLKVSGQTGACYIETKSLDGETNLKTKVVPKGTEVLLKNPDFEWEQLGEYKVRCGNPDPCLYNFDGVLYSPSNTIPYDFNNFLLRGSVLRRNEYIIGIVAYTGHESKIMLNARCSRNKTSNMQLLTGKRVLILFFVQILLAFAFAIFNATWTTIEGEKILYILAAAESSRSAFAKTLFQDFGTWNLIIAQVPISIVINLEFVRIFQMLFLQNDDEFRLDNPQFGKPEVNNSKILEDLGQVEHIFTDKTGTLTMNEMSFKAISIAGKMYGNVILDSQPMYKYENVTNVNFYDPEYFSVLNSKITEELRLSLLLLATCHTVVVDEVGVYQAASPDELALVNFAKFSNFEYMGRDEKNPNNINVKINNEIISYEMLHINEFSSETKKMSTVIRSPENDIILFSKGADEAILPLLNLHDKASLPLRESKDHLETFACQGLRTLVFSYKIITEGEYSTWRRELEIADNSIHNRESKRNKVFAEIEVNMSFLGVSAVEDKLQPDVKRTLQHFQSCGQKLWVITGDKLETTLTIASSCGIVDVLTPKYIINSDDFESVKCTVHQFYEELCIPTPKNSAEKQALIEDSVLVISGGALSQLMHYKEEGTGLMQKLMKIGSACKSVLVCRSSPKQKAEIVRHFRQFHPTKITLAIGDGANDVSMIVTAHIGVGIKGKEGSQAARTSDVAINEFRNLKPLLYVHGREIYVRNANLLNFIYYRNAVLTSATAYWGLMNGLSGQPISHYYIGPFYQLLYTSLSITVYAITDWQYSPRYMLETPETYIEIQNNKLYDRSTFINWQLSGVLQGVWIFIFAFYGLVDDGHGRTVSFWFNSQMLYIYTLLIVNLRVVMITYKITPVVILCVLVGVLTYISVFAVASTMDSFTLACVFKHLFMIPEFYLGGLLTVVCGIFVDVFISRYNTLSKEEKKEENNTNLSSRTPLDVLRL